MPLMSSAFMQYPAQEAFRWLRGAKIDPLANLQRSLPRRPYIYLYSLELLYHSMVLACPAVAPLHRAGCFNGLILNEICQTWHCLPFPPVSVKRIANKTEARVVGRRTQATLRLHGHPAQIARHQAPAIPVHSRSDLSTDDSTMTYETAWGGAS